MARTLERLLRPRSIAAIGGLAAERVIAQCRRLGFAGEIWPVHPSRDELGGYPAFSSVAVLPAAPDAAFIGVNREATIDIVGALAERGAGGAVCYASGFGEAPGGETFQAALVRAAGEMPLIGPNCYGLINYLDRVALWPDQHGGAPVKRGIAILTQSSNVALNLTMQRRGLPIACIVTAGNQAQVGLAEIALWLIEDERVSGLGLHIEGIVEAEAYERLAARARALEKPIIALPVGRSETARAATLSHTATLAGDAAIMAAFLSRLGFGAVQSLPAFLEALKLVHVHGALPGAALCAMSCSGGEAALMADAALDRGVHFPPLSAEHAARLKATLNDLVALANPLDYHTFIWADEAAMTATFSAMMGNGFDLSMLVLDFPRADRCEDGDWETAVAALKAATAATGGRAALVATLPENLPEPRAKALIDAGIAPLAGIDEAMAAAEAAALVGRRWREPPLPALMTAEAGTGRLHTLDEFQAKRRLADYGLVVPAGTVARSVPEAVAAAEALGFPVAIKALGLAHKSEAGGVRLDIWTPEEVAKAAAELSDLGQGLLVERMIGEATAELMIGVVRVPPFGLAMTIAAGGVLVELLDDAATLLLPAGEAEIRAAIDGLKCAAMLTGYRGRPAADLDAAAAAVLAIARFATDHGGRIEELDVNPLIVRPAGRGAVAADALLRIREEP